MKIKRYAAVVVLLVIANALGIHTIFAQGGSDFMTLNDATPGIDVVITPVPGATGAVALELVQASVIVVDSAGNTVFQMADPRVHKLELRLGPNASMYTLTVERLPGAAEAYVRIASETDLAEVSQAGQTVLVSDMRQPLSFQQSVDLPLSGTTPSQVANFSIPADQQGTMKVSFPGAPVTAQVVDSEGRAVATLSGGAIDGLSMVLEGGQYQLTLLNTNLEQQTLANMEIMPAQPSDLDSLVPAMAAQPVSGDTVAAVSSGSCLMTVDLSSVNLRSGPGTGYSVLNYGFRNDQYPVGGTNADGSWLVVGTPDGASAWVASSVGTLGGTCQNLTVYDIPYRNAPAPQIVVQQQPNVVVVAAPPSSASASSPSTGGSPSYEDDDHEDEGEDD